ncbi:MAG: hypothetical protein P1V34_07800 [Alphaproteobacteria bacterium]|nr:hypothetical protein [Alphaproteobacteria bacterium]
MRFSALLFVLLVLLLPLPALAQDSPLLILRIEALHGFAVDGRKAGLSGAVYALSRKTATNATQSLQIAYDSRNKPVLMRLAQVIGTEDDSTNLIDTARQLVTLIQPDWTEANTALPSLLAPKLAAFAKTNQALPAPIPLPTGKPGNLTFVPDQKLAVLDLPINTADETRMDAASLKQMISDASFIFAPATGDKGPYIRYHAPTGRFGAGLQGEGTTDTGSWSIQADGRYCIEQAPIPSQHCAALYQTGPGQYLYAPVVQDALDGKNMRAFTVVFGNPGGFSAPQRSDATQATVTRMILQGNTEERRMPSGALDKLYMDPTGVYRGVQNGEPASGTWTVLSDGRRCLINGITKESECAFLSETDGGTYRLYDAEKRSLGEALYRNGNPSGL